MTYRQSMHDLATAIADALTTPAPLAAPDQDVALIGYAAALDLLRQVHHDITGSSQRNTPRLISEAERNPVGLLGRLLNDIPRRDRLAPTDALAHRPASATGAAWQRVTRAAVLAADAWAAVDPAQRPTGEQAWAELADVGALTRGLLATTDDVATALEHTGRHTDAQHLRSVRDSGLAIAAEHTERLAAAGPLPAARDLPTRAVPRILVPRTADDLPEALRRLGTHLRGATRVGPRDIELIAQALAGTAHQAGRALATSSHSPDQALAAVLGQHADLLARASDTTRRLATIETTDPRPLAQAQAIHQYLAATRRADALPAAATARAIAAELPALSRTLDDATRRQIDRGLWLTPTEGHTPGRAAWTTVRGQPLEPPLVQRIRHATEQIHHPAAGPLIPPTRMAPTMARPREVLAAALARAPGADRLRTPGHPTRRTPSPTSVRRH